MFFSAIGNEPVRLVHEIQDLESTGLPLPQWWGLDIQYTGAGAVSDLAAPNATLTADGLSGSLVLEETAYEDGPVSAAVKSYNATPGHPVAQVEEYPNWGTPECVPAPYTAAAYLSVLGIDTGPLLASVDAKGRPKLTTSDGIPVVALKAGQYTIVVTDRSRKAGFRLGGSGFALRTGAAFRGTLTWTADLAPAQVYRASGALGSRQLFFPALP